MKRRALSTVACVFLLSAGLMISGCHKNSSNSAQNQSAASSNAAASQANPPAPPADQSATSSQSASPQQAQSAPPQQAQSQPAPQLVIPAGTEIEVWTDRDLGSKISRTGEAFSATVSRAVRVGGQVAIPKDARAEGVVVEAKPLGRFKGHAVLALRLERIRVGSHSFPVMSSTIARVRKGKGKRTGFMAAGGGALGAIIGGVAGGGRGALIGAGAGAGAGTAGSAFTGNKNIFLPAETVLTFRTERPITMQ